MSLHRRFAVLLTALSLLTALFVAGCGSSSGGSGADADPAQAIPASSIFYVEGVVRPEGEQKDNAEALIRRFLGDRTIADLVNDAAKEGGDGQTYEKDVKPWLGRRIGIGVTSLGADQPGFVGAIAVSDTDKAKAFVQRNSKGNPSKTYKDTTYYRDGGTFAGLAGDFLVLADEEAQLKRAIDAVDGDKALGDSERYQKAIEDLPDERLGAAYADLRGFGKLIAAAPDSDAAVGAIFNKLFADADPVSAALTAKPNSATIESRIPKSFTKRLGALGLFGSGASTPLVREVPEDSVAVLGSPDVGPSLKGALDTFAGAFGSAGITGSLEKQTGINLERDVFSWIGDVAIFVRGGSVAELNGAAVIEVTDDAAAKAAVPRLVAAAKRGGAPVQAASVAGADQAYEVPIGDARGPVVLAQGADRVVVAFGEQAAADGLNASSTIADSGLYDRAKASVDGIDPSTILNMPSILALVEQAVGDDPDYARAKPYLDKLDLIASGAEEDGDALRSLFTVKVR